MIAKLHQTAKLRSVSAVRPRCATISDFVLSLEDKIAALVIGHGLSEYLAGVPVLLIGSGAADEIAFTGRIVSELPVESLFYKTCPNLNDTDREGIVESIVALIEEEQQRSQYEAVVIIAKAGAEEVAGFLVNAVFGWNTTGAILASGDALLFDCVAGTGIPISASPRCEQALCR